MGTYQAEKIENLLDTVGFTKECDGCKYYKEWEESHPYGSTFAYETMAECGCENDDLCLRLNPGLK